MPTVECVSFPSPAACPIRLRYSDVPGTFTSVDFAAGCPDCHLVQIQPTRDRTSMEVHFTGCPSMLVDLRQAFDLQDIEAENHLLCPLAGEYRRAGLLVGIVHECLDENALRVRVERIGRPVEFVRKLAETGTDPISAEMGSVPIFG